MPQFLLILLEQSSHGLLDGLELLLDLVDADIVLLALVNLLEDLGNLLEESFVVLDDLTIPYFVLSCTLFSFS